VDLSAGPIGRSFIDQGYTNKPIPFSNELASLIKIAVSESFLSDPLLYQVPKYLIDICGNEVKRFIVALEAYYQSPNPLIPFKVLLDGISDPNFATFIKKTKVASLTRSFHMEACAEDGLDEYAYTGLTDIGDIFNYRYWFRWAEPEPEDWKFSLIDVPSISDELKEEFEEVLESMLPQTIPIVQPDEILLSTSSSSSKDSKHGENSFVWKDKSDPKKNTFSKDPLVGYRTLVYKCPTEYRDCIGLSIAQSNTIKLIEKQCAVLCKLLPYSGYGYPATEWQSVATKLRNKCEWYLNRDLTKEGWTKPRWILKSIGKVLKRKYPNIPAFDYFDIFSGFTLVLETGERVYTKRGHGLGMANALTTIMQCVVFQTIVNIGLFDIIGTVDALFYNDDGTIGALREESIDSYSNVEDDLLESFGLLRKDKKTYKGRVSIFLEDYWPSPINKKISYWDYVKRIPFSAVNVVAAKESYYLVCDSTYGEPDPVLFRKLITLFGYEHSVDEIYLPWWAGGWWRPKYKCVDCSFYGLPEINQLFARGVMVGPIVPKPKNFNVKGVYTSPLENLYNINEMEPEAFPYYDINQPLAKIAAKFHRMLRPEETYNWWWDQLCLRQKKWQTPAKVCDIWEYYCDIVKNNETIDFIPPQNFCCERNMSWASRYCERDFPIPVQQPNKLLGAIAFWSNGKYIKYVVPHLYIPGVELDYIINDHQKQKNFWDHWIEHYNQVNKLPLAVDHNMVIPNVLYTRYDYLNPYHVVEAYQSITGSYKYPQPLVSGKLVVLLKDWERYRVNIDAFSAPWRWTFWTSIGRTIPILDYIQPLTKSEWAEILQTGDDIEDPTVIPTDTPPPPGVTEDYLDFWTWWTGSCQGTVHPALLGFYEITAKAVEVSKIILFLMGVNTNREYHGNLEGIPVEGSNMDLICKTICHVEGFRQRDVYLYRAPDLSETWGADGDDGGGGLSDLFGDADS